MTDTPASSFNDHLPLRRMVSFFFLGPGPGPGLFIIRDGFLFRGFSLRIFLWGLFLRQLASRREGIALGETNTNRLCEIQLPFKGHFDA